MAAKPNYLDHLKSIPLFSTCSKKELEQVARLSDELELASGKVLMRQGSVGYECFVLINGKVSVEIDGHIVATLGPGAYFGELALLDKQPRSATVTGLTDLTVLVMGPREFSTMIDQIPGLSTKLLAGLARRIREIDAKFVGH